MYMRTKRRGQLRRCIVVHLAPHAAMFIFKVFGPIYLFTHRSFESPSRKLVIANACRPNIIPPPHTPLRHHDACQCRLCSTLLRHCRLCLTVPYSGFKLRDTVLGPHRFNGLLRPFLSISSSNDVSVASQCPFSFARIDLPCRPLPISGLR